MDIQPNHYDKILELFVSTDELRPKMLQPCKRGNFVFATDAYAVLKMPVKKTSLDYTQSHDFYDVEKIFHNEPNQSKVIDFSPIEEWFSTVSMTPIYSPCENCDGEGTLFCKHCKNEHDCPDCNGTGHGKKTGEEAPHHVQYNLDGIGFSYRNLYRLFLLAKQERAKAKWVFRDEKTVNLFRIGQIEIAICPMIR